MWTSSLFRGLFNVTSEISELGLSKFSDDRLNTFFQDGIFSGSVSFLLGWNKMAKSYSQGLNKIEFQKLIIIYIMKQNFIKCSKLEQDSYTFCKTKTTVNLMTIYLLSIDKAREKIFNCVS